MDAHKVTDGPVLLPIPASSHMVSVCLAVDDLEEFEFHALGAILAGGQMDHDQYQRVIRWTGKGVVDTGVHYTMVGPVASE